MEKIPDHPVYSKNVLEMLTVVNDFVMTLNKVETLNKKKLVEYLTKIAPLMYLKGALLPEVDVNNPQLNERFYTEEEWEILFNTLRKVFGEDDLFWYGDKEMSDELIKGSISEHICDVFQDMQDFFLLYQKSSLDAKENAVNEVSQLFVTNWGIKLLRIQQPLHRLFYKSVEESPGTNFPEFL